MGFDVLLQLLIPNRLILSEPELYCRGKLNELIENHNQYSQPLNLNIKVLALMTKNKEVDESFIFDQLSPSLDILGQIFKKRYDHVEKLIFKGSMMENFYNL